MAATNQPVAGATTILAPLEIRNNPNLPVTDTDHVQGGPRAVNTLAERDNIPPALRLANRTTCYVIGLDKTYILRNGTGNEHWIEDRRSTTGPTDGSTRIGIVRFEGKLSIPLNQAFTYRLPTEVFGPGSVAFASLAVQGQPGGFALNGQHELAGTASAQREGLMVFNATLVTGEKLQYVLGWEVTTVPPVQTAGLLKLEWHFFAGSGNGSYDYDIRLELNEPGVAETGQSCKPGLTNRFIGANTIASCLAIAPMAKAPGDGVGVMMYRFGISLANLRAAYPTKALVRFDVYAKRKAANLSGTPSTEASNALDALVVVERTSGLQSAPAPVGFAGIDAVTEQTASPLELLPIPATEALVAYLEVGLTSPAWNLVYLATPTVAVPQGLGGPFSITVPDEGNVPQGLSGPYSITVP